jgi:hypothetical protein
MNSKTILLNKAIILSLLLITACESPPATIVVPKVVQTKVVQTNEAEATPQISSEGNKDALSWDADIYASNMRVSFEEAVKRFKFQDIAGDLDAELSMNEAETFAGIWLEHVPEFKLIVQFTRNAEETFKPYFPTELADVIVEVRTVKVSLLDLQKAQDEIISSVSNLDIPVESGINVFENRVELYVADRVRFDEAVQSGRIRLPDNIEVITVEEMGKPDVDIYGGLPLSTCTSGFAVKLPDGSERITTAGHCDNAQSYNGKNLIFMWEVYTGPFDIQWHRTEDFTVTNKIQDSNTGSTRTITATKHRNNQIIGGYVCKYGMTSGYTCGYISDKNYCPAYVPNCSATFIRVDNTAGYNDLSSAGDSGGPWFLVETAYGTDSGTPGPDHNDAIYMAVNYLDEIGVYVMTAP